MVYHKTHGNTDSRQQAVISTTDPQVIIVYIVALFIHYVLKNLIINSWPLNRHHLASLKKNAFDGSEISGTQISVEDIQFCSVFLLEQLIVLTRRFLSIVRRALFAELFLSNSFSQLQI